MVFVQEIARVPPLLADDANTSRPVESNQVVEGQGYAGEFDFLDRDLYWTESVVQSLLDHLTAILVYLWAGLDTFSRDRWLLVF